MRRGNHRRRRHATREIPVSKYPYGRKTWRISSPTEKAAGLFRPSRCAQSAKYNTRGLRTTSFDRHLLVTSSTVRNAIFSFPALPRRPPPLFPLVRPRSMNCAVSLPASRIFRGFHADFLANPADARAHANCIEGRISAGSGRVFRKTD